MPGFPDSKANALLLCTEAGREINCIYTLRKLILTLTGQLIVIVVTSLP